jgi:hypothetical protein
MPAFLAKEMRQNKGKGRADDEQMEDVEGGDYGSVTSGESTGSEAGLMGNRRMQRRYKEEEQSSGDGDDSSEASDEDDDDDPWAETERQGAMQLKKEMDGLVKSGVAKNHGDALNQVFAPKLSMNAAYVEERFRY